MKKYFIYCAFMMVIFGCNSEKRSDFHTNITGALESTDTTFAEKIVKTADMRFRVKDVQDTKQKLSADIRAQGGKLTEFSIRSNIQNNEKIKYSADSLLELTSYRTEGYVMAKIPSEKLDEFINNVARLSVFIDQQSLKLDDQSIAYLANQLKNRNRAEGIAKFNKYAEKKSNNVETALSIQDDYVDSKIENLIIDSKTKYSEITLNFYQDNMVKKMIVENDNLSDFRPGFFKRFWLNIQNGWVLFGELILTLTNLWVVFFLGGIVYYIFRLYRKKAQPMALKDF